MSAAMDIPTPIQIPPHKSPNDLMVALGLFEAPQRLNRLVNLVTQHREVARYHEATSQSRSDKLLAENAQLLADVDAFYQTLRQARHVILARRQQVLEGRYTEQGCERWVKGLDQKERKCWDWADKVYELRNHVWFAGQRLNQGRKR